VINTESIEITLEMLALTAEVDEFKGAWLSLSALAPERMNAVRRIATIESIGSSTRIEGSKLTDREVERLLANLDVERFSSRDEQEVAGYAEVMETVFRNWSEIPLTENHLKQLHRDLLRQSEKDRRHRGEYKTLSNDVAAFVLGKNGKTKEKIARVSGAELDLFEHSLTLEIRGTAEERKKAKIGKRAKKQM
jgi:Fic family protein